MPVRILEHKIDLTTHRLHPSKIAAHFTYLLHVYISEEPVVSLYRLEGSRR